MAAGMLETWADEFTKLRKNVAAAAAKKPSFVKPKVIANASTHLQKDANLMGKSRKKGKEETTQKEVDQTPASCSEETSTLSESTVCLLLDRFVPC